MPCLNPLTNKLNFLLARVSCPEKGLHINCKLMDSHLNKKLMEDRQKGLSYRNLVKKYGVPLSTVHRIIMSKNKAFSQGSSFEDQAAGVSPEALRDDLATLKEELRKARLKIELLDNVIDIASKELGVDIRKKSGTRRL